MPIFRICQYFVYTELRGNNVGHTHQPRVGVTIHTGVSEPTVPHTTRCFFFFMFTTLPSSCCAVILRSTLSRMFYRSCHVYICTYIIEGKIIRRRRDSAGSVDSFVPAALLYCCVQRGSLQSDPRNRERLFGGPLSRVDNYVEFFRSKSNFRTQATMNCLLVSYGCLYGFFSHAFFSKDGRHPCNILVPPFTTERLASHHTTTPPLPSSSLLAGSTPNHKNARSVSLGFFTVVTASRAVVKFPCVESTIDPWQQKKNKHPCVSS